MLKKLRMRLAVIFTVITGAVLTVVLTVVSVQPMNQVSEANTVWFAIAVDRVLSTALGRALGEERAPLSASGYVVESKVDGQAAPGLLAADEEGKPTEEEREALFQLARQTAQQQLLAEDAKDEEQALMGWGFESQGFIFYAEDPRMYDTALRYATGEEIEAFEAAESVGMVSEARIAEAAEDDDALSEYDIAVSFMITPYTDTTDVFTVQHAGQSYRATYVDWYMMPVNGTEMQHHEVAILQSLAGERRERLLQVLWLAAIWLGGLGLLFLANWWLARLILRPTEEGLRRQTEFVAAASHELRSPLAVIRSSLSAAAGAADDAQRQKFTAAAGDEAERMSRLVDDLLLLAGGDAGTWQLQQQQVELDTLLIDAAEGYTPLAREKQVALVLDLPEQTLPRVQGDAERLRQIVAVLVDNALQYAPAGSRVTLAARPKKGRVLVEVRDEGAGVPDEEKDKVFERFYKTDKSRHDKAHFGLGLSVARELAELHKGQLTVQDNLGGGAVFCLSLPALG